MGPRRRAGTGQLRYCASVTARGGDASSSRLGVGPVAHPPNDQVIRSRTLGLHCDGSLRGPPSESWTSNISLGAGRWGGWLTGWWLHSVLPGRGGDMDPGSGRDGERGLGPGVTSTFIPLLAGSIVPIGGHTGKVPGTQSRLHGVRIGPALGGVGPYAGPSRAILRRIQLVLASPAWPANVSPRLALKWDGR